MSGMGLADAIRDLRQELSRARDTAASESLQFSLGPIELELQVELQASVGGKVDFKWVVVSASGETKGQSTTKHRIKLTLTPLDDGKTVKVGAETSNGF
jgi:hypothetical protein